MNSWFYDEKQEKGNATLFNSNNKDTRFMIFTCVYFHSICHLMIHVQPTVISIHRLFICATETFCSFSRQ